MRQAILAPVLCAGTMAFCQSTPSCSQKQATEPSPASPFANFDQLPPTWQAGIAAPGKAFTQLGKSFTWESKNAETEQKRRFNLTLPDASLLSVPLMAQNNPAPGLIKPWPNAKGEPIPTQWPNAKIEQLPTRWPNLKYSLINIEPPAPAK